MTRVLVLSLYASQAASHRVRFSQFSEPLSSLGIHLTINSLFPNSYVRSTYSGKPPNIFILLYSYIKRFFVCILLAHRYDILIVYAEAFPLFPFFLERLLLPTTFILDCDDAFYLKYTTGRLSFLGPFLSNKFVSLASCATCVTTANRHLSDYLSRYKVQCHYMPSVVDTSRLYPIPKSTLSPGSVSLTIGWIGSPSTGTYLSLVESTLLRLSSIYSLRILIVGAFPSLNPSLPLETVPWDLSSENSLINQFDIGIMPLTDTEWARGKSAFKLIQYMACGLPVVASRVGANIDVVTPDVGFLCADQDEWFDALSTLLSSPTRRASMGANGRKRALEHFSIQSQIPRLSSVLNEVNNH